MSKISLEIPDEIHFEMKDEQLRLEKLGKKVNLKDLYIEIIKNGLKQKKASQN